MNYSDIILRLRPLDIIAEHDKIWTVAAVSNRIYELDKLKKSLKTVAEFEHDIFGFGYDAMAKYNDRMFFIPKRADHIMVYDIIDKTFREIELRKNNIGQKEIYRETLKFVSAFCIGEVLFALGFFYPAIVVINMRTLDVKFLTDWIHKVDARINKGNNNGYFGRGYYMENDHVYVPLCCTNALLSIDLKTYNTELINIECEIEGITDMVKDEKYLWLTGRKETYGCIYRIDLCTNEAKIIPPIESRDHIIGHYQPFWKMENFGEYLYLFPYTARGSYKINKETLEVIEIKAIDVLEDRQDEFGELCNNYMVKRIDKTVYMVSFDGIWQEYDLENGTLHKYYYTIDNEIARKEIKKIIHGSFCHEAQIGLLSFIKNIGDDNA